MLVSRSLSLFPPLSLPLCTHETTHGTLHATRRHLYLAGERRRKKVNAQERKLKKRLQYNRVNTPLSFQLNFNKSFDNRWSTNGNLLGRKIAHLLKLIRNADAIRWNRVLRCLYQINIHTSFCRITERYFIYKILSF